MLVTSSTDGDARDDDDDNDDYHDDDDDDEIDWIAMIYTCNEMIYKQIGWLT